MSRFYRFDVRRRSHAMEADAENVAPELRSLSAGSRTVSSLRSVEPSTLGAAGGGGR